MPELKKATPEKTYREILLESRKRQLRLTATNVERLRITFDAAVESIRQKIESLPAAQTGTPWHRAMLQLQFETTTVMDALKRDTRTLLDVGMVELAQNAADREVEVAKLVEAPIDPTLLPSFDEQFPLTNGQRIPVQFGRLALGAVERVTTRYYRDGLKLSDRLHKLDLQGRKVIENVITQGIVEQISARDMAKRLQAAMGELAQDGKPPPRHVTMRIARTEINNAHREAHVMSTQAAPGQLKDYISGVRWALSLSHPSADICDSWAAYDSGLGPGVYLPADVPVDHPHGLCMTLSVLVNFPESGVGGKKPDLVNVPPSQIAYYARQGDKAALSMTQPPVQSATAMRLATPEERAALKLPPAWKNVQVATDPKASLQAIGTDTKGRTQYRYSAEHTAKQSVAKFARGRDFDLAQEKLTPRIIEDMKAEKEEAVVLRLIQQTGFRVGSNTETLAKVKAFGASTLKPEHVKIDGNNIAFDFVGKKGVKIQKTLVDPDLAKIISGRLEKETLFATSDANIRDYLHQIDGEFKVKDFRTWNGLAVARQAVSELPIPQTQEAYNAARLEVGKRVAAHLGNTPTVALESYIDPRVFQPWDAILSAGAKMLVYDAKTAESFALENREFYATTSFDALPDEAEYLRLTEADSLRDD